MISSRLIFFSAASPRALNTISPFSVRTFAECTRASDPVSFPRPTETPRPRAEGARLAVCDRLRFRSGNVRRGVRKTVSVRSVPEHDKIPDRACRLENKTKKKLNSSRPNVSARSSHARKRVSRAYTHRNIFIHARTRTYTYTYTGSGITPCVRH